MSDLGQQHRGAGGGRPGTRHGRARDCLPSRSWVVLKIHVVLPCAPRCVGGGLKAESPLSHTRVLTRMSLAKDPQECSCFQTQDPVQPPPGPPPGPVTLPLRSAGLGQDPYRFPEFPFCSLPRVGGGRALCRALGVGRGIKPGLAFEMLEVSQSKMPPRSGERAAGLPRAFYPSGSRLGASLTL